MQKCLTKDGRHFNIRRPNENDADNIISYLSVFSTNQGAIELYRDLGFIEEGRHIKAVKQLNGEYIDVLQMYVGDQINDHNLHNHP